MVILNYAQGDLQLIINELDVTVLTSEDGDEKVLAHIQESYQEYLEKRPPKPWRELYLHLKGEEERLSP